MSSYNQFRPTGLVSAPSGEDGTPLSELIAGTATELVIPTACTAVQSNFWQGWDRTKITKLSIKSPSLTIGKDAFKQCTKLTQIDLDTNLVLDSNAFSYCYTLKTVRIVANPSLPAVEPGATRTTIYIGSYAFKGCSLLEEFPFPQVTYIASDSFYGCNALTHIDTSAVSVGSNSFQVCKGLTSVTANEATSIGRQAFDSCSLLANASFEKATSVGSACFTRCYALKTVSLPAVKTVAADAFIYCNALDTVQLGSVGHPVTTIDPIAFNNCSASVQITVYIDTASGFTVPADKWDAPNATIIKRSSADGSIIE